MDIELTRYLVITLTTFILMIIYEEDIDETDRKKRVSTCLLASVCWFFVIPMLLILTLTGYGNDK